MIVGGWTPSEFLALMKALASFINPFTLLLNKISIVDSPLVSPKIVKTIIAIMALHSFLAIQAIATLVFRLTRKENGKRRKIWFWRKQYIYSGQKCPHYEPNGNLLIEVFQAIGCTCLAIWDIIIYRVATQSIVSYSNFGTGVFWLIACHLPGIVGFWFSSWSALYLILICPKQPTFSTTNRKNLAWNPWVMNSFCIGIPILIIVFFGVLGINLSIQLEGLKNTHSFLKTSLSQSRSLWLPGRELDNATTQLIAEPLKVLVGQCAQLIWNYQVLAFSWVAVSAFMLSFYSIATIALWGFLKRTFMLASGRSRLVLRQASYSQVHHDSKVAIGDILNTSAPHESINVEAEVPQRESNHGFAYKLRKNYYLVCASGALMAIALVVNIVFGLMMGFQISEGVHNNGSAAIALFGLSAFGTLLNSLSLLVQSTFFLLSSPRSRGPGV